MRAQLKAAIGLGVVLAALAGVFAVHAMTGGADSTKETVEATRTPEPGDARAKALSAVCAAGQQDCAEITAVADNERSCDEAADCAPSSVDGAPPITCDLKLACSDTSNEPGHCGPTLAIEACYPVAQPAGPYICPGTPTDVTPVVCRPWLCIHANGSNSMPQPSEPAPIGTTTPCKPGPCAPAPLDAATRLCAPPAACPSSPGGAPEETQPPAQCAPPPSPLPPDCVISSDGQVKCPPELPTADISGGIAPSGSGVAGGATPISGSAAP